MSERGRNYHHPVSNPTAAILVIGDEILSGRTRDENMYHLAGVLSEHGIDLREVRIVPDDTGAIVEAVNALRAAHDHVFTSGGIGPTHDDITADSIGAAFGVPVVVDEEADRRVRAFCQVRGVTYNEAQQRMARVPRGVTLIDNAISAAPGFTIENVHVMAGVPAIFRAMVAAILPGLAQGRPVVSGEYRIWRPEGDIAHALRTLAETNPDLSIGSYPSLQDGRSGTTVVVRGQDPDRVDATVRELGRLFPDG